MDDEKSVDGGSLPLICEKCGSDMRIVAFIMEPEQINRIMKYLLNNGRAPPGIAESSKI